MIYELSDTIGRSNSLRPIYLTGKIYEYSDVNYSGLYW
jgi:hypothetical protein